jgi:AcrR family transcriptional regulator
VTYGHGSFMTAAAAPSPSPSPSPVRSLREVRADETRARLFRAAAELFTSLGYHATTVDRIAARAGVAKGTFFVHFKTKGAVINELVGIQVRAARKARTLALETEGPLEAMRATVMTLGSQAGASKTLSRAVLAAGLESPEVGGETSALFDELYAEIISDAHVAERAGLLAPRVRPETLAAGLMASYLGAALHFTTSPRPQPLVEVLQPLVDLHIDTSRAPQASPTASRRSHSPKEANHAQRKHARSGSRRDR